MWNTIEVQNALTLCHEKKKFLYEARPDLFPQGFLTETETLLWSKFYERLNERQKKK